MADERVQALVLFAAGGAPCQVRPEVGDRGVRVAAGDFELDVAVKLLEADVAPDLRRGRLEEPSERSPSCSSTS